MPKVTICPPAPQTVFFQQNQFDKRLNGTDPIQYVRGNTQDLRKKKHLPSYGTKVKKQRLVKAEKALDGHENKEAIMKVLRTGH